MFQIHAEGESAGHDGRVVKLPGTEGQDPEVREETTEDETETETVH